MKDKHINTGIVVWTNLCRFILAGLFIFSGFVKAIDPVGSQYKIEDYLEAFGMTSWIPSFFPLILAVALSTIEFAIGICMLFGIRKKQTALFALLFMAFMTPLTLYLAIANPISDCGCFGDALPLTNWQTFWKNILLLIAAVSVFIWKDRILAFVTVKTEWLMTLYTLIFIIFLSVYCLRHLPIIDFRPYKIGNNIKELMSIPPGAKQSVYESVFILEKDGKKQEFTLDNYPDSTWKFIDARTIVREKGFEPAITDFSMTALETGEDITNKVLGDPGYNFLLIAHSMEEADDSYIDLINEIYDYSVENGYGFYGLTASVDYQIELWRDKTGAEYPFCLMDNLALKTIIRSNPGLMLIKGGTIVNKWSDKDLPDEYILTDRLENIPLGQIDHVNDWATVCKTIGWFFLPLLILLGLDLFLTRRAKLKAIKTRNL